VAGFVRFRNGSFSGPVIDPDENVATYITGRNNTGITTGYYETVNPFGYKGFIYSGGTFTTVELDPPYTYVEEVNDGGNYCGTTTESAFVSIGGTVTNFSVPGADGTGAEGINNLDQVAGSYSIGNVTYGYRRDADGTLDYPIAVPGVVFTGLRAINDQGWIVGNVSSPTSGTHGVLFRSPDQYVLYDYPGAGVTAFEGINNHGLICGDYFDDRGRVHGFIVRVRLAASE